MSSLNIILNGKNITGNSGESILELAKRNGIEIPTLCNDPRLEPYSSCYVCVVEVEGMRGLQPSCSTKITEGMKITTNNEKIFTARQAALNLLVSNHYADCVAPCKQTCPAGVDVQGYISLIEKGLYNEAASTCEKLLEQNPGNVYAHLLLGDTYDKLGKSKEAKEEYDAYKKLILVK